MTVPLARKRIYLDHASATPLRKEAAAAYQEYSALLGNPGALHSEGTDAARALASARSAIARELGCKSREIVFTSGLTESNNLAIVGFAQILQRSGDDFNRTHWIVSAIEHPSVLECFAEIERLGAQVSRIAPDPRGIVSPERVAEALRPETRFVSIGWANSEIGTIQPLSRIARAVRVHEKEHGTTILFHSDAGQAPLYLAPSVATLGVDLLSLGSGKLYGPRGIGALYIGKRAELAPVLMGGAQERGLRAGTESVALAAGFATALAWASAERGAEGKRLRKLRDEFAAGILAAIPDALINGDSKHALPHLLSISIPGISGEYLVLALDRAGLALSTKSACEEGSEQGSHVVAALGGSEWRATSTLRFSLGLGTTDVEMQRALEIVIGVCAQVRAIV